MSDVVDNMSQKKKGLVKVSLFYQWYDKNRDVYMEKNSLTKEYDYFDKTKVDEKRECGLHSKESQ